MFKAMAGVLGAYIVVNSLWWTITTVPHWVGPSHLSGLLAYTIATPGLIWDHCTSLLI